MRSVRSIAWLAILGALPLGALPAAGQETVPGQWKTAFVKRGFVGALQDDGLGGPGAILRSRTPIPFDGSEVRVRVSGCYNTAVTLESLSLVRGADDRGTVTGPHYPVLFKGKPSVSFTSITSLSRRR